MATLDELCQRYRIEWPDVEELLAQGSKGIERNGPFKAGQAHAMIMELFEMARARGVQRDELQAKYNKLAVAYTELRLEQDGG
jgi:hypothetical protein